MFKTNGAHANLGKQENNHRKYIHFRPGGGVSTWQDATLRIRFTRTLEKALPACANEGAPTGGS